MNILITTGIFPPEVGGPATFAAEFAARLRAAGHEAAVVTYSDVATDPRDADRAFPIHRVVRRSKLSNYARYFWRVFRIAGAYDIVYSLDWFSAGVPVMVACGLRNKKYVVRVGGGYIWEKYLSEGRPPLSLREFYERGLHTEYRFMYAAIRAVLRRAAAVIFNSQAQRALYAKHYGLSDAATHVVMNAVSEHNVASIIQNYNRKNRAKDKELVFAGRFIKMKNVESLIRAFARLRQAEYRLLLIGDGPTEPLLHSLVDELNIRDRVDFLPKLSQAELYARISNCHMFILPSWTDVSPHQVYECLALGIPVLLTKENYLDLPIPSEYLIDPHSIDDIAEKIRTLLDEAEYKRFTRALSGIEVRRSWNDVLSETMSILTTIA